MLCVFLVLADLILGQFVLLSKVLSQLANVCVIGYSEKKASSIRAVHAHTFSCFGIKCFLQCVLLTLTAGLPFDHPRSEHRSILNNF